MIYNDSFLNKLQRQQIQDKYAKITLLDWAERPVRSLEGEITGGNLNIDGNSAIRTTISLSMIVKDLDLTKYTIALRSKVSIEIGLKNKIDNTLPDIIWFKQGVFIVNSFNTSIGTTQSTVSISGKDKMCLLNGEISGSIPASTDFGQVDTYENVYAEIDTENYLPETYYYKETINDKDIYFLDYSPEAVENRKYYEKTSSITTTKLTIKEIIHNIVYIWGHEAKTRIIINDLELLGNELLEYRGETPMYLIKQADTNSNIFRNLIFDEDYVIDGTALKDWKDEEFYNLNAIDNYYNNVRRFKIDNSNVEYVIIKVEYGETIGYRATDLTFAGDLIAAPGESVVSILDKIKNMLGNYEYFYDVNGNFIFQAKHSYELVNYNKFLTDGNNEVYLDGSFYNNSIIHTFNDEEQTTQISHTPNLTNLRNDYSIWGERTSTSGNKTQIHLRYALQKKPELYCTIGDGARSGLILKAKADNNKELEKSNNILQKAYNNQTNLNLNIQRAKNNFTNFKASKEQEITDLRFKNTSSKIGSIKRILEVIKYRHQAKWKGKDGSEGYYGIKAESAFKDKNNKKDWLETFAQKHDIIVETAYAQFLKVMDLMYNDLINDPTIIEQILFSEKVIEETIDALYYYNPQNLTLYDEETANSLGIPSLVGRKGSDINKAFIWHGLFKYEYEIDPTNSVLKTYNNNWDVAYYYIYNAIMNKYNKAITKYQEALTEALQQKNYTSAISNIIKIWQLKNYQLYIKSFGEIERSLKYNAEADGVDVSTGEELYEDNDYSYLKLGLGYNFGKARPDYDEFMQTQRKDFLEYWLILNKERFDIFSNIKEIFSTIKDLLLGIKDNQQQLASDLHQYEVNYYTNMYNLITRVKEQQIPLIVDWRELIYQMSRDFYDYGENSKYNYLSMLINKNRTMLYDDFSTGYEPFYTDVISNWRSLYYNPLLESLEYSIKGATGNTIEDYNKENNWLVSIQKYPSTINFWFDLTEGQEGLNEFTISRIGDRLKTVKDNAVTAIYYKDTPNILYMDDNFQYITTENYNINSYSYFQLGGELTNLYTISAQGKSAFDELQDLLYKFTYCTENITITSLPIYTLKPNYRIMVYSKTPGLTGEFIVNKITVPLLYNGIMSINATKAVPYLGIN